MGYYSRIYGTLTPDQDVTMKTLDKLQEFHENDEYEIHYAAQLVLEDHSLGSVFVKAGSLDFTASDMLKLYDGASIVKSYLENAKNAGVTYSGTLDIEGEENDDIWRIIVKESEVFTQRPRIIWDDEDIIKGYGND
jgi:hypothetical protein